MGSALYIREGKDCAGKTIPADTLKYYLENSAEYVGRAKSVRFRLIENQQGYTPLNPDAGQSKVTTAMVFDYDALTENYGIDLDIDQGYKEDEDEAAGPEQENAAPPSIFDTIDEDD